MTNPEKNKSYREVRQESFTDSEGNTHTNVTRTSETLEQRDNENTSRGLIIGFVLAGVAALVGSAFWYFNQSSQTVDNNTATPTTSAPVSTPSPLVIETPAPQQTKIIERTKEVPVTVEKTKEVPIFVPVPEQTTAPTPAVKNDNAPNANITVPPTQQPEVQQTASPNSSTSNSNSNSDSSSNSTSSSTPTTSGSGDPGASQDTSSTNTTTTGKGN